MVVAAVEDGLKEVCEDMAIRVRQRLIGLLIRAKPPPTNIPPSERKALRDLKNDADLMILPADKGYRSFGQNGL